MKITISNQTTVEGIQREFRSLFPGLKLEFYSGKPGVRPGYPDTKKLHPQYLIASKNPYILNSDIEINSSDKVSEIEKMLFEKFGFYAQIFFKSNSRWIQTVKSDHYSLRRLRRELGFSRDFLLL